MLTSDPEVDETTVPLVTEENVDLIWTPGGGDEAGWPRDGVQAEKSPPISVLALVMCGVTVSGPSGEAVGIGCVKLASVSGLVGETAVMSTVLWGVLWVRPSGLVLTALVGSEIV